jgi:hypothetical protein
MSNEVMGLKSRDDDQAKALGWVQGKNANQLLDNIQHTAPTAANF